jgi:hypothetical protein
MAREKLEHEIEDGVWEGSFTQKILVDSRASNRNFGGSGGQEMVREQKFHPVGFLSAERW